MGDCQCYSALQYTLGAEDGYDVETPVYGACGATTAKTFAQGHDAKLKSVLISLNRAGLPYMVVQGGLLIDKDPMAEAMQRGWDMFLTPAKPRKVRKTEAVKAEEVETAPDRVDLLERMKLAAEELKARGQYGNRSKDRIQITPENVESILDGTHPGLRDLKVDESELVRISIPAAGLRSTEEDESGK